MAARTTRLAALGLLGLAAAAPLQPRQTTCYSGVYMIVARGSNEPAGEGVSQEVVSLVQNMVPDSGSIAVVYPAAIISSSSTYPASVTDGINDAKQELQNYVDACGSDYPVALIGYSQGGNVMTDLLAGGVDKPAPITSDLAQSLSAVTVFGDPTFTVGQSFDQGNATKSGIFSRGGSSLALLNTYADIIQSYCMVHDPFCATGDDLSVHLEEVQTFAQAAANFIASSVS